MMTGEYFLSEKAKKDISREKKREQKEDRKEGKALERNKTLEVPEDEPSAAKYVNKKPTDIEGLKNKFLKSK